MKILLVDDERLSLDFLSELLNWQECGYDLIGCATNGAEALRMIKANPPDIVITDISMPVLDGLGLSKEIRSSYPDIKVVLLTAYRDFEYAQQAMRYGVTDYLLKNQINEKGLLELLERMSKEILRSQKSRNAIQNHYYQNLLLGITEDQAESSGTGDISLRALVRVKPPYLLTELTSYKTPEILLDKEAIRRGAPIRLLQLLGLSQGCWGLVFSPGPGESPEPHVLEAVLAFLENYFQEHFHVEAAVLLDWGPATPQSVKESFQGMLDYSEYSIFMRMNRPVSYRTGERYQNQDDGHETVKAALGAIQTAFSTGGMENLNSELDRLLHHFSAPCCNLGRFRYVFARVTDLLDSIRGQNNLSPLNPYLLQNQAELLTLTSAWEIWNWIASEFNRIFQEIGGNALLVKDKKILLAVSYIHKNYMHKLTAKGVGESVELSEVYFSNLFKKETGCTFLEYLTEHRMNVAKYLIGEGMYKVYEIAEMTGYNSPQYFSQIFQKTTGCTPYEYSRKGGRDETQR